MLYIPHNVKKWEKMFTYSIFSHRTVIYLTIYWDIDVIFTVQFNLPVRNPFIRNMKAWNLKQTVFRKEDHTQCKGKQRPVSLPPMQFSCVTKQHKAS